MPIIFKTSLDNVAKRITITVTLLFACIISGQYIIIKNAGETTPIYISVALLFIYLIVFAFRPINYKLTSAYLIIHRLVSDVKIDRSKIESVAYLEQEQIGLAIRTFGVGGLFGYFGKFTSTKIGSMTWYATRISNTVLIKTIDNKKIILTPDEPEKFVETLKS